MFDFRFYEIWREPAFVEALLAGCWNSLWLATLGGLSGFLFGLFLAATQDNIANYLIRLSSLWFVELIRNTPFIVQLFFVAFGLPLLLGYRWSFEASALLAITLNFSAYFAEVLRAGLDNIPKCNLESAKALGLNWCQTFFVISLPQCLGNMYPSLISQFIFLFLTTGLISEIGVEDLTWAGRFIADRNFRDFEVYLVLTLLYLFLSILLRGFLTFIGNKTFKWTAYI